jgi:hypothetical protein
VYGYQGFLAAIAAPEHEDHDGLQEWAGSSFDPEAFDPAAATREMPRATGLEADGVSADHAMLKELQIADIKVGRQHRRDMGDQRGRETA